MVSTFEQEPSRVDGPLGLVIGKEGYPFQGLILKPLDTEQLTNAYDSSFSPVVAGREIRLESGNSGLINGTIDLVVANDRILRNAIRSAQQESPREEVIFAGSKISSELDSRGVIDTPFEDTALSPAELQRSTIGKKSLVSNAPLILRTRFNRNFEAQRTALSKLDIELNIGSKKYKLPEPPPNTSEPPMERTDHYLIPFGDKKGHSKIVLLPYDQRITRFISLIARPKE